MSDERPTDGDRTSTGRPTDGRADGSADSIELGAPFRSHVADVFGFEAEPTTFRELWERMLTTFAANLDRPLSTADLCTTDASPHRTVTDGESQSFQCVVDAIVFAGTCDDSATVRTVSPLYAEELTVEFDATDPVTVPDDAVLSVGIKRSARAPEGPVTPERMYGRLCPYNRAFVSREEYEQWADAHPEVAAESVPLDEAVRLFVRLAGQALDADGESGRDGSDGDAGCSCVSGRD